MIGLNLRSVGWLTVVAIIGCSDDGAAPLQGGTADADGATAVADGDGGGDDGATGSQGEITSGDDGTAGDDAGTGGVDTTAGGAPEPTMCTRDEDCIAINSCCECGAAHKDDPVDECREECFAPLCDANAIDPIAACVDGTCQLVPVDCNGAHVVCDAAPPKCPENQLPSIENGCWTGACVPAEACETVPDCLACGRDSACVVSSAQAGPFYTCVPIPRQCDGVPTCGCMGELACEPPMWTCSDVPPGADLACSCPAC